MLFQQFVSILNTAPNADGAFSGTYGGFSVKGKQKSTLPIAEIEFYASVSGDVNGDLARFNRELNSKYNNEPMSYNGNFFAVNIDFSDKTEQTAKGLLNDIVNFLEEIGAVPTYVPQSVSTSSTYTVSQNSYGSNGSYGANSNFGDNSGFYSGSSSNGSGYGSNNSFNNNNRFGTPSTVSGSTSSNRTFGIPATQNHMQSAPAGAFGEENFIMGIIGSAIGTILGMVVWIVISQFGYISIIGGLCIAGGAFYGYKIAAKGISKKAFAVAIVMLIIGVAVANYLSMVFMIVFELDFSFGEALSMMPIALEDSEIKSAYVYDLVLGYIISAIAAFSIISISTEWKYHMSNR